MVISNTRTIIPMSPQSERDGNPWSSRNRSFNNPGVHHIVSVGWIFAECEIASSIATPSALCPSDGHYFARLLHCISSPRSYRKTRGSSMY